MSPTAPPVVADFNAMLKVEDELIAGWLLGRGRSWWNCLPTGHATIGGAGYRLSPTAPPVVADFSAMLNVEDELISGWLLGRGRSWWNWLPTGHATIGGAIGDYILLRANSCNATANHRGNPQNVRDCSSLFTAGVGMEDPSPQNSVRSLRET